jgi:hypothetical protein
VRFLIGAADGFDDEARAVSRNDQRDANFWRRSYAQ